MLRFELSEEDAAYLRGVLERDLSDLRYELGRTEVPEYHDRMRAERDQLERILVALGAPVAPTAATPGAVRE